ncbi:MAG: AAA family ATPase [bacterium]
MKHFGLTDEAREIWRKIWEGRSSVEISYLVDTIQFDSPELAGQLAEIRPYTEVSLDDLNEKIIHEADFLKKCGEKAEDDVIDKTCIIDVLLDEMTAIQSEEPPEEPVPDFGSDRSELVNFGKNSSENINVAGLTMEALKKYVKTYLTDITAKAREENQPYVVGRDYEIREVCETLLRPTKPNPLIVGRAGVGKTALVEGLAQMIVSGEIKQFENHSLYELKMGSLVSGTEYRGKFAERLEAMIRFAREQEGVILFIDELHMAMGLGRTEGTSSGLSDLLKPEIDRGNIQVIGSTTSHEYEKYIANDTAFERRFSLIPLQELSITATREVLIEVASQRELELGLEIPLETIEEVLNLSRNCLRHRVFPDKAIDLLDKCIGSVSYENKGVITPEIVKQELFNFLGFKIQSIEELDKHLTGISERALERLPVSGEWADQFEDILRVSYVGQDKNPELPNLIVGVQGGDSDASRITRDICYAIFGRENRTVELELPPGGMITLQEQELKRSRGLKQLNRQPSSVILLSPKDRGDGSSKVYWQGVRETLEHGSLTTDSGETVYFSDAVVVLALPNKNSLGFKTTMPAAAKTPEHIPTPDLWIELD